MQLLLICSILLHYSASHWISDLDYNLPKWRNLDQEDVAPVSLGKDTDSGCMCREVPFKLVVCFGRDSCRKFPRGLRTLWKLFQFRTTMVEMLNAGDFDHFTQLETLEIEGNVVLSAIAKGTFRNMTNLRNMSISYNPNLVQLGQGTFEGLANLQELFIIKNGFLDIKDVSFALSPAALPQLQILNMNENTFKRIASNDFAPMAHSTLQELSLVLCQIEYVHPEALEPLTHLAALRIGENRFNASTISQLIAASIRNNNVPLMNLNLYSLGFRKTPPRQLLETIADSNITKLNLGRNQFEVISATTFPYMPRIEVLKLTEVLALNISYNAFIGMPNLRSLLLNGNKLSGIPPGVLLEQLIHLDLSSNIGDSNFPSYFSIGANKFVNMRKLMVLNLSFNRINSIFNTSFTGLSNLRVLLLNNSTIFHIADNTFLPLKNLMLLNLENNHISEDYDLLNANTFMGLANVEVLLLGGCSLTNLNDNLFAPLTSLTHLGLQSNNLLTVNPMQFYPLVKLQVIDLSENWLATWHQSLFHSPNLTTIRIANNKITYFSDEMLSDFANLTHLDVAFNPFTCDCLAFEPLRNRVRLYGAEILNLLKEQKSFCIYPDLNIIDYFESYQNGSVACDFDATSDLIIFYMIPVIILLIFIGVMALVGYLYRWHIRYWLFLARLNLRRVGKLRNRSNLTDKDYKYDAFVSYSNEDCNFVVRLVAMLEDYEPYLKLCVYERDFRIGAVISKTVLESVAQSRRTLLIISDSYARSQWCQWEVQIAEHHRLFLENDNGKYVDDSLIMIKLGEVADVHMTPTLKYLMKTRIYLEWNAETKRQKVFWDKLRHALRRTSDCIPHSNKSPDNYI